MLFLQLNIKFLLLFQLKRPNNNTKNVPYISGGLFLAVVKLIWLMFNCSKSMFVIYLVNKFTARQPFVKTFHDLANNDQKSKFPVEGKLDEYLI